MKMALTFFVILTVFTISAFSQQKSSSLVALPYAYYTPETEIAVGVGSIYSFRPEGSHMEARPSNIRAALTFTQLKQMIIAVQPELYFSSAKWLVNGTYNYYKYPDKFWGVGGETRDSAEEDFTPSLFRSFTHIQYSAMPGLYVGVRLQVENLTMKETDPEGTLRLHQITGSKGGAAVGAGFLINRDTRDHIYFPTRGSYHQVYAVFFGPSIGSDFQFNMLTLDLRKYIRLTGNHVLALQSYNIFIDGAPPFQMLALLGGSYWMRGYYFGRYRDKNMYTMQAEYRYPLFWRFGGVLFAGVGDVAGSLDRFHLNDMKTSAGMGLRFMFDTREKINARLDLGFDREGTLSIYALVVEAF